MGFDKAFSCRLYPNERDYLDKHYEGQFSKYVHDSFKRDIALAKNNKKTNKIQSMANTVVMLGLGAIFILFSINIDNLLGFLMVFFMGGFFMVYSLFNIFMEVKKHYG